MGSKYAVKQYVCSTLVIFAQKSKKTFTSIANVVNTAFTQYSHSVANVHVQEEIHIQDNFTSVCGRYE